MKLDKKINIALVATIVIAVVAFCYVLYSSNFLGAKQTVVNHTRKSLTVSKVTNVTSIKNTVTNNDYADKGWQKIGMIAIPDLGILLPIYNQPYNQDALKVGAQELTNSDPSATSNLRIGNFTLVAHNYNDGHTMFSALQQNANQDAPYLINGQRGNNDWLDGKKIYVAGESGIYEYIITGQSTVSENNTSILNGNQNQIQIITCLFPSDHNRIVTRGKPVAKYMWDSAPADVVSLFDTQNNKINF